MKKIILLTMLLTGLAAFFEAKAQCTFTITNLSNCDIGVYTTFDDGGGNLASVLIMVAAGATVPVTLGSCVGIVEQSVTNLGLNWVFVPLAVGVAVAYTDCYGFAASATWQANDDVLVQ